MANRYWVGGTASWDGTAGTKWATTSGGTGGASVPTSADDVFFDANSGTGTVTIATGNTGAKSVDCTGFTGTLTGTAAINVYGNYTLVSGMTYTFTGGVRMNATGTITSAGKTFASVNCLTSGMTLTFGDALTSTGTLTLTAGTLNLNNFTITFGAFASNSSTNVRSISFGTGNLTITGSGSIWSATTSGNLGIFTASGNRTVNITNNTSTATTVSNLGAAPAISFNFLAGTYVLSFGSSSSFINLDFTGFAGTLNNASAQVSGDLTFSSGMTTSSGTASISFNGGGTQLLTTNGITINGNLSKSSFGTLKLQDALTLNSLRTFVFSDGILDLNGYSLTCGLFNAGLTSTREIINVSGGINLTGSGSIWQTQSTTSNITLNDVNVTIIDNNTNAREFLGRGLSYGNLTLTGSNNYTLTINQSNTFKTVSSTKTSAVTVSLEAGSTQTVTNWNLSGTSGNLVTLNSTLAGTQASISQATGTVSVSFCDIKDNNATGGATFQALDTNGNINSGNNTGWSFRAILASASISCTALLVALANSTFNGNAQVSSTGLVSSNANRIVNRSANITSDATVQSKAFYTADSIANITSTATLTSFANKIIFDSASITGNAQTELDAIRIRTFSGNINSSTDVSALANVDFSAIGNITSDCFVSLLANVTYSTSPVITCNATVITNARILGEGWTPTPIEDNTWTEIPASDNTWTEITYNGNTWLKQG